MMRFWRDQDGAALVEFALLLPVALLLLAVTFEAGRGFWAYQATVSGVRDAARYLGRVAPRDICATGGDLSAWEPELTRIVRETQGGATLFPASIRIDAVTAALACTADGYRGGAAPVAQVTAQLSIDLPFKGIFRLAGVALEDVTTYVADQARVLGS